MQAHILHDGLAQGVAIEENMPDQAHSFRVNHLPGVQSNTGVSGQLFGQIPKLVVGAGGNAQIRIFQGFQAKAGEGFNPGAIQQPERIQVMHERQCAGGRNLRGIRLVRLRVHADGWLRVVVCQCDTKCQAIGTASQRLAIASTIAWYASG